MYTLHNILYALRLTKDNRVLCATGNVRYYYGSKLHVSAPEEYESLHKAITWLYPSLRHVKIATHWEGVIAVNLADRPAIGRSGNVFYSLAYCGHGVALANHCGMIIRDLYLNKDSPCTRLPFVNTAPFPPIPGEPIRKLIDFTYINYLRWRDNRTNRIVSKRLHADWPEPPHATYSYPARHNSLLLFGIFLMLISLLLRIWL